MQAVETTKQQALADWLIADGYRNEDEDMPEELTYDDSMFEFGSREYMVLTDDEADERAKQDIEQSLWAFNASFLVDYLPEGVGEEVIEALQPQCEGANEAIRSMVGDRFDELVEDAISADGRGHFLNTYDGDEHEAGEFFIYRTN